MRLQGATLHLCQGLLVLALFGIWEALGRLGLIDRFLFGSPIGIFAFLADGLFLSGSIWADAGWTMEGVLLAFLLGSAMAMVLAAAFARWPVLEQLLEPVLASLNAMPRIALAPMFIIWFGLGIWSKVGNVLILPCLWLIPRPLKAEVDRPAD